MRFNFGQRKRIEKRQSRNLGQLRTQKGEKSQLESEPGPTSDTERRKRSIRVRTRVNFGHRKEKRAGQSQNLVQLRTQKGERGASESEAWPTSDTERRKGQARVRTRANFGHRKEKRAGQSQNLVQLRTEKEDREASESEPGSTSDTERRKEPVRVGTRANFGHRKEKEEH